MLVWNGPQLDPRLWRKSKVLSPLYTSVGKPGSAIAGWSQVLSWAYNALKRNTTRNIVLKLCFQAAMYHTWRERNNWLHLKPPMSAQALTVLVKQEVTSRILGLPKIRRNCDISFLFSSTASSWGPCGYLEFTDPSMLIAFSELWSWNNSEGYDGSLSYNTQGWIA